MDAKAVFKKSKDVVTRVIDGQVILMPLHKSSKDLNYIYTLNETASCAWNLIDGKTSLANIQSRLVEEYDVPETKAAKQLAEFIKDLKSIKAIV